MQDFRNTKIEILSKEHSAAFQEAVFKAGGSWEFPSKASPDHLNKPFLFVDINLFLTYSDNIDCFEGKEYEEIFFPEPNKGHIHQVLMAQYAEDAKRTDKPWELWQIKRGSIDWISCTQNPSWDASFEYRHKPKTKLVHGIEIPDFEFTPKVGEAFYAANVGLPEFFEHGQRASEHCTFTQRMIGRGLIYPYTEEGKHAAILHSKVMWGSSSP